MPTNLTKHNASPSITHIAGVAAWDDVLATWDGSTYPWDSNPAVIDATKHAATVTNIAKS